MFWTAQKDWETLRVFPMLAKLKQVRNENETSTHTKTWTDLCVEAKRKEGTVMKS